MPPGRRHVQQGHQDEGAQMQARMREDELRYGRSGICVPARCGHLPIRGISPAAPSQRHAPIIENVDVEGPRRPSAARAPAGGTLDLLDEI